MSKEEIRLYFLNINLISEKDYIKFYYNLSTERKKRMQKYMNTKAKKQCIVSEILVKYILEKNNIPYDISYNRYGKPLVDSINFNVSHSEDWVVLAVSSRNVGVDIERIVDEAIGNDFFSSEELDYIIKGNQCDYYKRITEIWTKKESYLKYLGTGLYKDLDSFSSVSDYGKIIDDGKQIDTVMINTITFDNEYIVSVCGKFFEIVKNMLSKNDLYRMLNKK